MNTEQIKQYMKLVKNTTWRRGVSCERPISQSSWPVMRQIQKGNNNCEPKTVTLLCFRFNYTGVDVVNVSMGTFHVSTLVNPTRPELNRN